MAEAKTKPTAVSVEDFIAGVEDPKRREDARVVAALMAGVTGEPATMWGPSIIGFGRYHYRYDSGHEGDAPLAGFSPRKTNLVFYMAAYDGAREGFLARLGKHKTGKGCVYVNRLADIDLDVLREMTAASVATLKARYPG
jgi:hypothetical protein